MSDTTVLVFVQAWIDGLGAWIIFCLWRKLQLARDLISEETKRKISHTEVFEMLKDEQLILEDFEANAIASEALRAKRTTTIRENAGPPAIIHKPPTRSVQPRSDIGKFFRDRTNQLDVSDSED